jgi:integrase
MSVRKRNWTTRKGESREAWIVTYDDARGARRQKSFARKRDADAFEATATVEVSKGVHVPDSTSVTVVAAGKFWIETATAAGLTATTLSQYRQHLDLHISPFLGTMKVSTLTVPVIRAFEDRLREEGRSVAMRRKVLVSLGSLIGDAVERGLAIRNPVRDMRVGRKGKERRQERRHKGKLKVGVDIPAPAEIKSFLASLTGRWRPLLLTATFSGLRASELRGLRWSDIDLERRTLRVCQRADAHNEIAAPKSEAGDRTVPLPPLVANALKEWKLACPKSKLGLAFPNASGGVESHNAIRGKGLIPAWIIEPGLLQQALRSTERISTSKTSCSRWMRSGP